MDASAWAVLAVFSSAMFAALGLFPPSELYDVDPKQLSGLWDAEHVSPEDPYLLKNADLKIHLEKLAVRHRGIVNPATLGKSAEGRKISIVRIGTGAGNILLWSQMHGDEPTATSAMLDLFEFLGRHRDEGWVSEILAKYTLLCIPMLNPDGAERNQRRNAQGLDINRDARLLQTPEGVLLKAARDRHQPFLGFNLHNQNSLTTVGDTGRVATIALLAVAADAAAGEPGKEPQMLAKQVTAVLYEVLSPFVYGHISRYDETYNPRAFGDNLTAWGTPIVLIETGGLPAGQTPAFAVKLNFVGLLAVLNSLASGKIRNANPAVFDSLEMNSSNPIYDLMLKEGWVFTGTGLPPFRADIGIRGDLRVDSGGEAIIAELGDLSVFSAHRTLDCRNTLVTPGLITWDPGVKPHSGGTRPEEYLRQGITTVLESQPGTELGVSPPPGSGSYEDRGINWGFLILGGPGKESGGWDMRLAEWMAAGARGWVSAPGLKVSGVSARIPGWFGLEAMTESEAARYRVPRDLSGNVSALLPHWTSEAARKFRLARRGAIALGNVADLVVWSCPPGDGPPEDLRRCRPTHVIVNGEVIDGANPSPARRGRFLGRSR
jgi:hypothetical protein